MTSIQNLPVSNENIKNIVSDTSSSKTFDCSKSNEYSFVVVENPNRKNDAEPLIPEDLNIVIGKEIMAKINLPNSEAKNFSLDSVEKTKTGFELKVEWGGGL